MSEFKRLLDDGSEMDRMLLSAGLEEAPPSRSLERTLGALGVGGAALVGTTAVGAAVGEATAASVAVTTTKGAALGLFAKLACGLALGGTALGGGYWMASREADERARIEFEASAAAPRADAPNGSSERVRLPHEGTAGPASTGDASSPPDAESKRTQTPAVAPAEAPGKRAAAPATPAASAALGAEVALLDQAHAALRSGDVEACLSRLRAYESRYPDGQLKAEASELRARALKSRP